MVLHPNYESASNIGHPVALPSYTPESSSHSSCSDLADIPFLPGRLLMIARFSSSSSIGVPAGDAFYESADAGAMALPEQRYSEVVA